MCGCVLFTRARLCAIYTLRESGVGFVVRHKFISQRLMLIALSLSLSFPMGMSVCLFLCLSFTVISYTAYCFGYGHSNGREIGRYLCNTDFLCFFLLLLAILPSNINTQIQLVLHTRNGERPTRVCVLLSGKKC